MAVQDVTGVIRFGGGLLKRFTSTFGINSTPTSVDLEIIEDPDDVLANNFDQDGLNPGNLTGIQVGQFKFSGIVTSWQQEISANGETYSIRLSDPRFVFDNVFMFLDGSTFGSGVEVPNILNPINFYGNPTTADSTELGMTFTKIRTFLENPSTLVWVYGHPFHLEFAEEFSTSLIPSWYRVNATSLSLQQLVSKVASDFNIDYFVDIDYDTFNPVQTGKIMISAINRNQAIAAIDIDSFLTDQIASGTRVSHRRGKELRSEPNVSVVVGANKTFWHVTPNDFGMGIGGNNIAFWGEMENGSLVRSPSINSENKAIIRLDNIQGEATLKSRSNFGSLIGEVTITANHILHTDPFLGSPVPEIVEIQYDTITRITGNPYPPSWIRTFTTRQVSGYTASEELLRAAMYSWEAWEAILFRENFQLSKKLGITTAPFFTQNEITSKINYNNLSAINHVRQGKPVIGSGVLGRSIFQEAVSKAVWEITKATAEEYYGTSYIVSLPESDWFVSGTWSGGESIPRLEYQISDTSWAKGFGDGVSYPEDVNNHELLTQSNSSIYKDQNGKLRSFLSIREYDQSNSYHSRPIDLSSIDRSTLFFEQGNKIVMPASATHYKLNPTQAIIKTPPVLLEISGSHIDNAYYEFLQYHGYSDEVIVSGQMLNNKEIAQIYGLGERRKSLYESTTTLLGSTIVGLGIALEYNNQKYGPFSITGSKIAGVNLVEDSSLAPWTYGSTDNMNEAGRQLVSGISVTSYIVDSADILLAGLPEFNIGQFVGQNSTITSMSFQYGSEGLTTNYQIRTYAYPQDKVTKKLQDKILKISLDEKKPRQSVIVDFDANKAVIEAPKIKSSADLGKPFSGKNSEIYLFSIPSNNPDGSGTSQPSNYRDAKTGS